MKRFMILSVVALAVVSCASLDSGIIVDRGWNPETPIIEVARYNDVSGRYQRATYFLTTEQRNALHVGDFVAIKTVGYKKYVVVPIESEAEKRLITHGRE